MSRSIIDHILDNRLSVKDVSEMINFKEYNCEGGIVSNSYLCDSIEKLMLDNKLTVEDVCGVFGFALSCDSCKAGVLCDSCEESVIYLLSAMFLSKMEEFKENIERKENLYGGFLGEGIAVKEFCKVFDLKESEFKMMNLKLNNCEIMCGGSDLCDLCKESRDREESEDDEY